MSGDLKACIEALSGLDLDVNPATVQQKSRDLYWYSPILKRQLGAVTADFVVAPRNEDEVVRVLATCWKYDVPVTVRGAGTGNYGQAMPLFGGAVLHTKHLDRIVKVGPGHIIAQPGVVIEHLEKTARESGREIRLFPSTAATATIGGFIAGGSSGVGAIRWGGLRNPANLRRLRLVTMEEMPRIIELVGEDISKAAHAYGVNGVITEVELPIDPASDWVDVLIGVDGFDRATALAIALGEDEAISKRMLSTFEAPIPELYFRRHGPFLVDGEAAIAMMVSRDSLAALEAHLSPLDHAHLRFRADTAEATGKLPAVYELAWNHTTLRALRIDPSITYLQMMLPRDRLDESFAAVRDTFGDELMMHCEFTRFDGVVTPVALPLVRFTSEERLEEIIMTIEGKLGLPVFNPHRVTLEEGGMKRTDVGQLEFKKQTDPKGLMNPGKMIAWTEPDWAPVAGKTFLFAK
ncbi:MAG: FAD-binding oxidoreductase [Nitratireductor sp.]